MLKKTLYYRLYRKREYYPKDRHDNIILTKPVLFRSFSDLWAVSVHSKQINREDPFIVADYFDVPERDVTDELIDQYFEEILMDVNYPEELREEDEEE